MSASLVDQVRSEIETAAAGGEGRAEHLFPGAPGSHARLSGRRIDLVPLRRRCWNFAGVKRTRRVFDPRCGVNQRARAPLRRDSWVMLRTDLAPEFAPATAERRRAGAILLPVRVAKLLRCRPARPTNCWGTSFRWSPRA